MKDKEKTPMWIGLHIPLSEGYINVCIGIDQEDGHEVAFYNDSDYEEYKKTEEGPWSYGSPHMGEIEISVSRGTNGYVFDENHKLIKS